MDEAQNGRCCVAEHKVHLESGSHHKPNLTELRVIFRHSPNKAAALFVAWAMVEICSNPDLVHAAREHMEQAFGTGELIPQYRRLTLAEKS